VHLPDTVFRPTSMWDQLFLLLRLAGRLLHIPVGHSLSPMTGKQAAFGYAIVCFVHDKTNIYSAWIFRVVETAISQPTPVQTHVLTVAAMGVFCVIHTLGQVSLLLPSRNGP
jgi:hypothetical protein